MDRFSNTFQPINIVDRKTLTTDTKINPRWPIYIIIVYL